MTFLSDVPRNAKKRTKSFPQCPSSDLLNARRGTLTMMDPERGTEESFGGVRVRIDELEEASKTGLDVPRKSAPVASGKEKNTGPSDNEPDGPSTPSTVPRVTLPPASEYHDFPDAPVAVIMSKDVSSDPPVTTAMSNGNASGPPNSSVSVGVLPSKPSGTATTTNDPQTWLHEIPQAGATPTNTGARPPPVQRDEPGWMTSLYLGESGRRFPFSVPSRLRPYVSWIPVLLRLLQAVFALVAFATAASMSHPKTCVFENADNGTDNTSSNSTSTVPADLLEQLVNNAMCLPGRTYKQFSSLEFLVVINACAFFWVRIGAFPNPGTLVTAPLSVHYS